MKAVRLLGVVTMVCGALHAADWTIDVATNVTETTLTYDDVYVNAPLSVGADGVVNLSAGKHVYIPGSSAGDVTVTVSDGGTFSWVGSSGGIALGEKGGKGTLVLEGAKDFTAKTLFVGGSAAAHDTGYIDFLTVKTGPMSDGHPTRVRINQVSSWGRSPARLRFDGSYAAIAPAGADPFFAPKDGMTIVLEGVNGGNIMFVIGSWFGSYKTKTILSHGDVGFLRTQGTCDLIFHNHNAYVTKQNPAGNHTFVLEDSTNRYQWAHTGATVISNGCTLVTKADYALPNGPQTGRMEFRELNWMSVPALDLCGTKQIVNGIVDFVSVYNDNVRGTVTNSSETVAELILGAHNEDSTYCVGTTSTNIVIRKIGTGTLTVATDSRFNGTAFNVEGGTVVFDATRNAVAMGPVTVSDGTLIVDGCTLTCSRISTTGAGKVILRNSGRLVGSATADIPITIESMGANHSIASFDGFDTSTGSVAVKKEGGHLLTFVPNATAFSDVDVREGTLRVAGTLSSAKYWKFTFTKVSAVGSFTGKNIDGVEQTFTPELALNRLHLLGVGSNSVVNYALADAGTGVAREDLAASRITANQPYIHSDGFWGAGGMLRTPATLCSSFDNWFVGCGFTNGAPISASNPLEIMFRLSDTAQPAVGYLFSKCVNFDASRPLSWKVETWDGAQWVLMDEQTDVEGVGQGPQTYGHESVPFLWSSQASSWSFAPTGTVAVAQDAVLDLSEIAPADVAIKTLAVDLTAGAGAISNFVPAAQGALYLTSPQASQLKSTGSLNPHVTLPLAVTVAEGVDCAAALATWKVYVDGVLAQHSTLQYIKGELVVVTPAGTLIRVR